MIQQNIIKLETAYKNVKNSFVLHFKFNLLQLWYFMRYLVVFKQNFFNVWLFKIQNVRKKLILLPKIHPSMQFCIIKAVLPASSNVWHFWLLPLNVRFCKSSSRSSEEIWVGKDSKNIAYIMQTVVLTVYHLRQPTTVYQKTLRNYFIFYADDRL